MEPWFLDSSLSFDESSHRVRRLNLGLVLCKHVEALWLYEYGSTSSCKVALITQICFEPGRHYSHIGQSNSIPLEDLGAMEPDP